MTLVDLRFQLISHRVERVRVFRVERMWFHLCECAKRRASDLQQIFMMISRISHS